VIVNVVDILGGQSRDMGQNLVILLSWVTTYFS